MIDPTEHIQKSASKKHWEPIGIRHHHGVLLPLLALHSEQSCGCGEYTDLYKLIDWLPSVGMDILQLLPLNDSGVDPSPYNALSASALHPVYLGLEKLPLLSPTLKKELLSFKRYNTTVKVHYEEVLTKKLDFLRRYVAHTKEHFLQDPAYQAFLNVADWLNEYVLFKALKDRFEGTSWTEWPEAYKNPSKTHRKALLKEYAEEATFHAIVQYLCYLQLKGVHDYAQQRGVFLKGDIPILISPDSCDVWAHPELFDMSLAAGAPPDRFNPNWQYWGFPLYVWKAHREENFRYWKSRLKYAEHFYAMYRIDHVVGFFRIWGTARGTAPKFGQFIPEERFEWLYQGEEILRVMLDSTTMLPIAEDLGVVPDVIKERIIELGIAGTRVFRWELYKPEEVNFIPFEEYPPVSLSTASTHDTETLELWWRDESEQASRFAAFIGTRYEPILSPELRERLLKMVHHAPSLFHVNLLQEYLAFHEDLRWDAPEDERINIPGYVLPSNWTYRSKAPLEVLCAHDGLSATVKALITEEP